MLNAKYGSPVGLSVFIEFAFKWLDMDTCGFMCLIGHIYYAIYI